MFTNPHTCVWYVGVCEKLWAECIILRYSLIKKNPQQNNGKEPWDNFFSEDKSLDRFCMKYRSVSYRSSWRVSHLYWYHKMCVGGKPGSRLTLWFNLKHYSPAAYIVFSVGVHRWIKCVWASSEHGANTDKCEKGELTTSTHWWGSPWSSVITFVVWVAALHPQITASAGTSLCWLSGGNSHGRSEFVSYEPLAKWFINLGTCISQIKSPFGNLRKKILSPMCDV